METLTQAELRAMEAALAAYRDFMARTEDAAARTSRFSVGELLNDTSTRAWEIVEEQRANLSRFIDRRNELIETSPPPHEEVAAFVESVRRQAGSPLPALMDAERQSNTGTAIVGGAIADTARDAVGALKIGLPVLGLLALAYVVFVFRRHS